MIDALLIGPSVRLINSRGQVVATPREEQIVSLVNGGLNNREIARELNLKENTVKKSLLRIYDKLAVSNRVELVLYALSHCKREHPILWKKTSQSEASERNGAPAPCLRPFNQLDAPPQMIR